MNFILSSGPKFEIQYQGLSSTPIWKAGPTGRIYSVDMASDRLRGDIDEAGQHMGVLAGGFVDDGRHDQSVDQ